MATCVIETSRSDGKLPVDDDFLITDQRSIELDSEVSRSQKKKNKKKKKKKKKNNNQPNRLSDAELPVDDDSPITEEHCIELDTEVSRSQINEKKKKKKKKKKPKALSPKVKPDEYLDYFPSDYVICGNGQKIYTKLPRPIKKKKPREEKNNRRVNEKREDLENIFWESEEMEENSRIFAGEALSYLSDQGHKLELVKPGAYELGEIALGYRAHFNFKAKREDDPSAPVEMYFGQLRFYLYSDDIIVECCVSMGEAEFLPYEPKNRGCGFCTKYVHHPLGGCKGIVWGLLSYSRETGCFDLI